MSLIRYARYMLVEWLLLLGSVCALSFSVLEGFVAGDGYPLRFVIVVAVVLLSALYLAAFKRKYLALGFAGVVTAAAVVVGASLALSTGEDVYADAAGCYLWPTLAVVVCSLLGFFLTRFRTGCALWLVGCTFSASLSQAMFEGGHVASAIVALACSMALLLWRNVMEAQQGADVLRRVSMSANLAISALPVFAVVGLACLLWFGVVSALNPGALHLEIIPEWRTAPIVEMKGVGDTSLKINTDSKSADLRDGERYTTDDLVVDQHAEKEVPAKSVQDKEKRSADAGSGNSGKAQAGANEKLAEDSTEKKWDAVSYDLDLPAVIFIALAFALLILAIVAFFLLRRRRRHQRLLGWMEGDRRSLVCSIYLFLMEKQRRLGFEVAPGITVSEFSANSARGMEGLREQTNVPFDVLTQTYVRCAYGGYEPTADEAAPFVTYYLWFWKAARAYLGNVRYFFRSFRLG